MKAAVLYEPHTPLRIEEMELDEPKDFEVRVRLVGGGVSHSDYHRIDGHSAADTLPFVMGHEGAGIVQQVGVGVAHVATGDHVVFSLTAQCGRCRYCAAGRPNLCEAHPKGSGKMPDGTMRFSKDGVPYYHGLATFSEETVVPEGSVVKIREDIPLEKACLIGCGVMTGVGAVINRAKVETGSTVVVFGCGGVGLNVVQGGEAGNGGQDHRRGQSRLQAKEGRRARRYALRRRREGRPGEASAGDHRRRSRLCL